MPRPTSRRNGNNGGGKKTTTLSKATTPEEGFRIGSEFDTTAAAPTNRTFNRGGGGAENSLNHYQHTGHPLHLSHHSREADDTNHSRMDHPSCRLLQDIATRIWNAPTQQQQQQHAPGDKHSSATSRITPNATSTMVIQDPSVGASTPAASLWIGLLRQYLLERQEEKERQQPQQEQGEDTPHLLGGSIGCGTVDGTGGATKKRKKKKKKKVETTATTGTLDSSSTETTITLSSATATAESTPLIVNGDEVVVVVAGPPPPPATVQKSIAPQPPNKSGTEKSSTKRNLENDNEDSASPALPTRTIGAPTTTASSLRIRRDQLVREYLHRTRDDTIKSLQPTNGGNVTSTTTTATTTTLSTIANTPPRSALDTITQFVEEYLAGSDQTRSKSCRIPHSIVQLAIDRIQCNQCRRSVNESIHQQQPYTNKTMTGPVTIPLFAEYHEHHHHHLASSDDKLFDYVAMEEGLGQPGWHFVCDKRSETSNELLWELRFRDATKNDRGNDGHDNVLATPDATATDRTDESYKGERDFKRNISGADSNDIANGTLDSESKCQQWNPWSMEFWDLWLMHGVILGGTDVDRLLGICPSSPVDPNSFCDSIHNFMMQHEETFASMQNEIVLSMSEFNRDTRDHAAGGNIEMSSFPAMKKMDSLISRMLQLLLRIVIEVTTSVQNILHRYRQSLSNPVQDPSCAKYGWLLDIVDKLWQAYCVGLQKVIDAIAKYERQVLELANAQGRIPEMFCSAALRTLYRDLVKSKTTILVQDTIHPMRQVLDTKVDLLDPIRCGAEWRTSLIRYLAADRAFHPQTGNNPTSVDLAIEDTLKQVQSWTETVHQPTGEKMMAIHVQHRDQMMHSLRHLQKELQSAMVNEPDNPFMWNMLRHVKILLEPASDDTTGVSLLRSNVAAGIIEIVVPWIRCKVDGSGSGGQAVDAIDIPFNLRRELALATVGRSIHSPCTGGNGRSRVEFIFMVILFDWMKERFQEWQAEIAEKELLAISTNETIPKIHTGNKKSKKKKSGAVAKKAADLRPKDASKNTEESRGAALVSHDETDVDNTIVDVGNRPASYERNSANRSEFMDVQQVDQNDTNVESPGGNVSQSSNSAKDFFMLDEIPEGKSNDGDVNDMSEVDGNVVLFDGSQSFETAENFFVNRLLEVLKEDNVVLWSGTL